MINFPKLKHFLIQETRPFLEYLLGGLAVLYLLYIIANGVRCLNGLE